MANKPVSKVQITPSNKQNTQRAVYVLAVVVLLIIDGALNQLAFSSELSGQNQAIKNSFTETFQSGLKTPPFVTKGKGSPNDPTFGDDPSEEGTNKVMISNLPAPATSWNNIDRRSEIRRSGPAINNVPTWHPNNSSWSYQFRIYVPADHYCDPDFPELINQYHHSRNSPVKGGPPLMVRIEDCEIKVKWRYQSTEDSSPEEGVINSGVNLVLGAWNYLILDVHWNWDSGYAGLYHRVGSWPTSEDKIVNYQGGLGYNDGDDLGVNQEYGVYKWDFIKASDATTYKNNRASNCASCDENRKYYYDDITTKSGTEFGVP